MSDTDKTGLENPVHVRLFAEYVIDQSKEQFIEFARQFTHKDIVLQCLNDITNFCAGILIITDFAKSPVVKSQITFRIIAQNFIQLYGAALNAHHLESTLVVHSDQIPTRLIVNAIDHFDQYLTARRRWQCPSLGQGVGHIINFICQTITRREPILILPIQLSIITLNSDQLPLTMGIQFMQGPQVVLCSVVLHQNSVTHRQIGHIQIGQIYLSGHHLTYALTLQTGQGLG